MAQDGKRPRRSYEERARRELVCRDRDYPDTLAQGDRSWFRPGQLICDRRTAGTYLRGFDRPVDDVSLGRREGLQVDLVQVLLDPGVDVFDLTAWIRREAVRRDDERVVVGPNYCWRGEPVYHGGPGGQPRPAKPRDLPEAKTADERDVDIATLDTGYVTGLPEQLMSRLRPDENDGDPLDADANGLLDTQSGHGSFVAGVVHQVAPELVIDPGRVLDSTGVGDDATVTRELLENRAPVVNLSLGGYTEDDRAPTGLGEVIRALARETVLVAAAGNNASDRPFWPAALKGVLAVAAYDSANGSVRRAAFSNYGPWVDVCAPGQGIVSTFATWPPAGAGGEGQFEGWAEWDGTSFAAPQVAAVLAREARRLRGEQQAVLPGALLGWFLASCHVDAALADYGLVWKPETVLT